MSRIGDRIILAVHRLENLIDGLTDTPHLTTDPACERHRPVKPGSRLDRASRGVSCRPCMYAAAWPDECSVIDLVLREAAPALSKALDDQIAAYAARVDAGMSSTTYPEETP